MKLERLYHSAVMLALRTRTRRTKYLKKHNILGSAGLVKAVNGYHGLYRYTPK